MKLLDKYMVLLGTLLLAFSSCQKSDNYYIKEEALNVSFNVYNGSNSVLETVVDTIKMKYDISTNSALQRSYIYVFEESQSNVTVSIRERGSGKPVYEKQVSKGQYTLDVDFVYIDGKAVELPVVPDPMDSAMLVSFFFIPAISGYTKEMDIAYVKLYQVLENGSLVNEKEEELARITATPYTFSPFLEAPVFKGGRTEIDGKTYFLNPAVRLYQKGTQTPYYEDAGFTISAGVSVPIPTESQPRCWVITEQGSTDSKNINRYAQTKL